MAVRKYKPTTPGRRGASVSSFEEITRATPEKSLVAKGRKKAGRNVHGRITTRHQGGGNKQRYRLVDFRRNKDGIPAKVAQIEYDPNRSARIALLHYVDGEKRYILAPLGLRVGDTVTAGEGADTLALLAHQAWRRIVDVDLGLGRRRHEAAADVGGDDGQRHERHHLPLPSDPGEGEQPDRRGRAGRP